MPRFQHSWLRCWIVRMARILQSCISFAGMSNYDPERNIAVAGYTHRITIMPEHNESHEMTQPPSEGRQGETGGSAIQRDTLPILPLRNIVFFPGQIMPLFVGRPSSVRLIEEAHQAQRSVLVLTQRDSTIDAPHTTDLYETGTVVRVVKIYTMPDGSKSVVVQGLHRARI